MKKCIGKNAPPGSLNVCRDAGVAVATVALGYQDVASGRYVSATVGTEYQVYPADCPGETVMLAQAPEGTDAEIVARWFGYSSPAAFAAALAPQANVSSLLDQPTGPALSEVLLAHLPQRTVPDSPDQVIYTAEVLPAPAAAARQRSARAVRLAGPGADQGVCAQVCLVLEQEAVATRKAIGATLEISNESDTDPLENIGVTINIYDAAGNLANDRFLILKPELTRLTKMDAPTTQGLILNGEPLRLAPATTGSARWVILPTDAAAPLQPQQYFVGGVLAYTAGGVPGSAELVPGGVTVYPNAKLYLKYFHQRDVYSDDPFTDEIEPSIPFLLGVMIENRGNGLARNLSITSGQPKIVENVKGLLIDFNIVATEVAGRSLTPSLTASFGDLEPHRTAIGRWYLKSTLQGLFLDYQATLEHDDRFGERGASVFEGVEIHELIHQVEALGPFADGKPDFLVNDEPDDEDLPDTVHLSDATTAPVTVVRAATHDGAPTADDLVVELTAPLPAGFAYLRVPEPGDGRFRLTGVRRSDGRDLALGLNAWTTDRTFLGLGKRPRYENLLHLFDHDSTGRYTLTYTRDERVPDTTAPVSRIANLPPTSPAQIPLSWTGSDDALGTGIATYDIFVSVEGGPFTRWLERTRNTASIYQGAAGRRYAFYSIARDAAGNTEPAPLAPHAFTLTTGNSPPTITSAPSASVDEGQLVEIQIAATDADLPGDTLAFSLVAAPAGMQIHPTTGRITWQTTEPDGPKNHTVTVRVTDNGDPPLSAERNLTVFVRELNAAPTLAPLAHRVINEGRLLSFTVLASDSDWPSQTLTFSLGAGAPPGASLDASNGLFRWTPTEYQGPSTNLLTIVVTDSGTPPLSATQSFTVIVHDVLGDFSLSLGATNLFVGEAKSVPILLDSGLDLTNVVFRLEVPPGHLSGLALEALSGEVRTGSLQPAGATAHTLSFALDPVPRDSGSRQIARLRFVAEPGQSSAIVPLRCLELRGIRSQGSIVSNAWGFGGRVIVVANEPVLLLEPATGLTLFGHPGVTYEIQRSDRVGAHADWRTVTHLTLAGRWTSLPELGYSGEAGFYRARQRADGLPRLHLDPDAEPWRLSLRGVPGRSYQLQTTTKLSAAWQPVLSLDLTNGLRTLDWTNRGESLRLFRLRE
ncbi:MAG: cadherin repeat domain-containing protein [Verrucomicrobia bacterium]|nr:cadherin repeat domain-containing protein [Verrucomicrobiota bacterium]